jgi:signal peptidase
MIKILKFTYTICFVCLVLIGSLLLLTAFPAPGINLDARVVQSGSMEPAITTGSVIFILPAKEYVVDDIITYRMNEQETPTTHRVVDIDEETGTFITKGDANTSNDMGRVKKENIIGSVRFHIPFLGYVINFAKQPLGFFLLVILPAIIISADEVKKIIQEVKKKPKPQQKKSLTKKIKISKQLRQKIRQPQKTKRKIHEMKERPRPVKKRRLDMS